MELQKVKEQLVEWMSMMKYGYRDEEMYIYQLKSEIHTNGGIRIKLFTETNSYAITAFPPEKNFNGYLGCTTNSRKPRAGESWTRGNDLADGEFSKDTWIKILGDIVGYELVKIHRPVKLLDEGGKSK